MLQLRNFSIVLICLNCWSQENQNMNAVITLGDKTLEVCERNQQSTSDFVFLNVHQDEVTSIQALHHFDTLDNFAYFYLKHDETRRITFSIKNKKYSIDPNRIYTKKGIRRTLKDDTGKSRKAVKSVQKFSKEIIDRILPFVTVVAVHNNTDINYSIKSYLPGGDEAQNTKKIHVTNQMDADDFIYTTDENFFEKFKARDINVILQDNEGYVNDGSLSVYCGKNGVPYINIETQKGHLKQQIELIEIVLEILREK